MGLTLAMVVWFAPWGNREANRFLGIMLGLFSLLSIGHIATSEGRLAPYLMTFFSLDYTLGPLVYLYTLAITSNRSVWKLSSLWHILPAAVAATIWVLQVSINGYDNTPESCPDPLTCELYYSSRVGHRMGVVFITALYSLAALRLLKPHLEQVKARYSTIEDVNLRWLRVLLYMLLATAAVGAMIEARRYFTGLHNISTWALMAFLPLVLSILTGSLGLLQQRILIAGPSSEPEPEEPKIDAVPKVTAQKNVEDVENGEAIAERKNSKNAAPKVEKYKTSRLSQEEAVQIWAQLEQFMVQEKPYLEVGLKISDLAQMMGVSSNHLSETLNGQSQQSFYECINRYRVEEAARLLCAEEYAYLSVTDIGFQSGFNSNSTFFAHFKTHFEMTPNQYRKQTR